MNKKASVSGTVFDVTNHIFMIILCITILYPFLYIAALSLSSGDTATTRIFIIPKNITFSNFKYMLRYKYIWTGIYNTVLRTCLGTLLTLVLCILTSYPLSKKKLPYRTFITALMVFTMFFSGGMIPWYLNIKMLGLRDTIWALILPGAIPTYSMLIMRNYFMSIPDSIEESAKVDGGKDLRILASIIVPISKPIIATVALWTIVGHWNSYFDSMIYITTAEKHVLQVVMRNIVVGSQAHKQMNYSDIVKSASSFEAVNSETLKAATIMITTIPIITIYPFVQKYFVKGILIGSLKG